MSNTTSQIKPHPTLTTLMPTNLMQTNTSNNRYEIIWNKHDPKALWTHWEMPLEFFITNPSRERAKMGMRLQQIDCQRIANMKIGRRSPFRIAMMCMIWIWKRCWIFSGNLCVWNGRPRRRGKQATVTTILYWVHSIHTYVRDGLCVRVNLLVDP